MGPCPEQHIYGGTTAQLGEEVISFAHTIKVRALARLGELLCDIRKNVGAKGSKVTGSNREPVKDSTPTLADLGISKKTSSVAQQLAALPSETREAIAQQETTIARARRERQADEVKKAVSLPDAKYRVLYADPPWSYNDKADAGSVQAGGAARHSPSKEPGRAGSRRKRTGCGKSPEETR